MLTQEDIEILSDYGWYIETNEYGVSISPLTFYRQLSFSAFDYGYLTTDEEIRNEVERIKKEIASKKTP